MLGIYRTLVRYIRSTFHNTSMNGPVCIYDAMYILLFCWLYNQWICRY